jgi:hypothetical protein
MTKLSPETKPPMRSALKTHSNSPVVYMVGDIIILMRENPLLGPLEGVGPEIRDFFVP